MVADIELVYAGDIYDRTRPLREGAVDVDGVKLRFLTMGPEEGFTRFMKGEFDAAEFSFSMYIMMRSKGIDEISALPVFPSRAFRHSAIYVRPGIEAPEQLKGATIGVPEYPMTAALVVRAVLEGDYGVSPQDISWVTGGLEDAGREAKVKFDAPAGLRISQLPADQTLLDAFRDGILDGVISARPPSLYLRSPDQMARLFSSHRELELDWYSRHRVFPIMHVVCLRSEVVERHSWIPANMYRAFCEAKRLAYGQLEEGAANTYMLAWQSAYLREEKRLLGDDPWAYGVQENRHVVEAMISYSLAQGLIKHPLVVEDLFISSTLESPKI